MQFILAYYLLFNSFSKSFIYLFWLTLKYVLANNFIIKLLTSTSSVKSSSIVSFEISLNNPIHLPFILVFSILNVYSFKYSFDVIVKYVGKLFLSYSIKWVSSIISILDKSLLQE